MHYLKLDAALLESSLWVDFDASRVFVAAALMAEPDEIDEATPQLAVRSLELTGWMVPPGWYGIVRAAGPGIVRRALLDPEPGLNALERLGQPDPESRSANYEGRRLVRIDGGYVVLNLMRFRERDTTAAERMKRYRANKKRRRRVTPSLPVTGRNVTQAVADADGSVEEKTTAAVGGKNAATEEIAEARQRYTTNQLAVIDAAVAGFATTRKNGKIAESVVAAEHCWWASFPAEQVVAGLQIYVDKRYALDGKGEKYARGIVRRTDPLSAGLDGTSRAVPSAGNGRGAAQPARDNYLSPAQLREIEHGQR